MSRHKPKPPPTATWSMRTVKRPFPAERKRHLAILAPMPTTTTKPKRGGKREGAGRKPLVPDEASVVYALRVTHAQRAKIDALGGQAALRKLIDKAKVKP